MHFFASTLSCCRKLGCANSMMLSARSVEESPFRFTEPNSVTIQCVSVRGVVTGPSRRGTIREIVSFAAVERVVIMERPPLDAYAPLTKSNCPPEALYWCPSKYSELQAPVRSICKVALMETTFSFCAMIPGSLT